MRDEHEPVTRILSGIEYRRNPPQGVQAAADNADFASEFLVKAIRGFLIADGSRFEYTSESTCNDLQRIQKVVDVCRQERRIQFATDRIDGAIPTHDGTKIGLFLFQKGFEFP